MGNQDPPDNNTPSADKGKGRDDGSQDNSVPEADQGSSVFTRIAKSAAGLSRDALSARPTGNDLGTLAANSGKAGQSGLPATSGPSSQLQSGESSSFRQTSVRPGAAGGFASSHVSQHVSAQEDEFAQFLSSAPDLTLPSEPLPGTEFESTFASVAHTQPQRYATSGSTATTFNQHTAPLGQDQSAEVAEQERLDGLDVVNLLSTGPEEEPNYADIELAEEEIETLRKALFGNSTAADRGQPSAEEWDNVLNFIPDFVRPNAQGYEEEGVTSAPATKAYESRAALGVGHTSETTRLWLDQWHDVLVRYDDEVWGGLSHLVAQAREEVDELQKGPPPTDRPSDTKALDRLRQILGHLRG